MLALLAGPRAAAQPAAIDTGLLTRLGHLGGETRGLCQTDDYVYMGMGAELLVFDVATIIDAQHPIGRLMLPALIEGIDAAGDLLAVAVGSAGVRFRFGD